MSEVFIYPKNPIVIELVKANKKRSLALDNLKGEKGKCKWCMDDMGESKKKYCSEACKDSAWAFFYPQKFARKYLIARDGNVCAHCKYDFKLETKTFKRRLKFATGWDKETRETSYDYDEVEYVDYGDTDHIIPIEFGGEILGIENLQILCKDCHKIKTAKDRREFGAKKKAESEAQALFDA